MDSKVSRLGKNTLLVFVGNIGSKLIGLLMMPFYTSWLSVSDYGLSDIITVYVTFFMGIVTCCIGESLFIFPKGADIVKQSKYFSSGLCFLIMVLAVTALLFEGIDLWAGCFSVVNSFVDNIWLIYFMLVSQIVQQVSQQFTRSIDQMKVYSITGIVSTIFTAIFTFLMIPQFGVAGYVWSIILANIVAGLYSFFASSSYKFFSFKNYDKSFLKTMLKYSIPLIPNGVMWWLVNALNRPLMEHHLGMHDIGIFAIANKFPGILSMVFAVFTTSWQISVLEEFGKDGFVKFYNNVFKLVFLVLIIILISITFCSKLIVSVFASEDFFDAWQYVPFLTLGVLFANVSGFAGSVFSATKESKYFFYSSLWGAISAIVLNFILIPLYGIMGACLSVIVSFFVMAISRFIYSWKYLKISNVMFYFSLIAIMISEIIMFVEEVNFLFLLIPLMLIVIAVFFGIRNSVFALLNR